MSSSKVIKGSPLVVWVLQVLRGDEWCNVEKLFDSKKQVEEFCASHYRVNPNADLRVLAYAQVDCFIKIAEELNELIDEVEEAK